MKWKAVLAVPAVGLAGMLVAAKLLTVGNTRGTVTILLALPVVPLQVEVAFAT